MSHSWRNFFSIISHAHFKSTDIRRLEAAIAVYSGLTSIGRVKMEVLKKLCDMLRNPIAKVDIPSCLQVSLEQR